MDRTACAPASGVQRGGYVLWESSTQPDVILIGTGSEVHIALDAAKLLQNRGVTPRVVSLPSWELFDAQPSEYRNTVLPANITARVAMEAATTLGWERYVGLAGVALGLPHFGASAPAEELYQQFGLTPERMAEEAEKLVKRS